MLFSNYIRAAALFAAMASAIPIAMPPTATEVQIVNNLNHTIYAWSVSNTQGEMQTLVPAGGTFTESWRTNPDGGGISIKLSSTTEVSKVLQFEYTAESETVWWDLSCINMEKNSWFTEYGFSAVPSVESCPSAKCAAGDSDCSEAYQNPDDVDTLSCSSDSVIKLVLG
ncbi:putative antigenic thaumatin domain protein [Aspergillus aculeatinus CBS 121060]|uniref:Antigenic thaumatin domain protein n=1 Tax=Aspergillus aculeatinus CBS 121060 TaxID=1448322 RepID=A0ACD1H1P0_9EURO|nr:putative antigenic thaumatin domain protein [Aspergillus aculeatinus CBS 121060]RAH67459.1 putative antigenic thaumatin domain protein [Aspergillus aculeatinus CBS 121060]